MTSSDDIVDAFIVQHRVQCSAPLNRLWAGQVVKGRDQAGDARLLPSRDRMYGEGAPWIRN